MKSASQILTLLRRAVGLSTAEPSRAQGRDYGLIFIGGCPRSGTTALQFYLGGHTAIATARETHLIQFYIGPFLHSYRNEEEATQCPDGIRGFISESETMDWLRKFSGAVFEKIRALKPGASIVLEKTPDNAAFGRDIAVLFPHACFISIVRDPRGVAASFFAAARHPWGAWAPANAQDASKKWLAAIDTIPVLDSAFGQRHSVIRYEDFLDPTSDARVKLIGFLASRFPRHAFDVTQFTLPEIGAPVDLGLTDDRNNPAKEDRTGFFRRGVAEGWRAELSAADIETIERLCGPAMRKFGYLTA